MIDRREFLHFSTLAGAGLLASAVPERAARLVDTSLTAAPAAETEGQAARQPAPPAFADTDTTSDIIVETLIAWGASHAFGMVGDGVNSFIEAMRKRRDRIRYIPVRHEEAAAFMASGHAKLTGRLGVCVATTGPGAIHLINGLYDAALDGAPVVAITGSTFHDLGNTRFIQAIETVPLMKEFALYNTLVSGPRHAVFVANLACRAALGARGVAHLTIAKDIQAKRLAEDRPSMENHGARTSSSWLPAISAPPPDQLRAAAELLNSGDKVAILAGQGALPARRELEEVADALAAPVAKALLGKAVLPDDSPFTTGGIGHLGTEPSSWAMHHCDRVLILCSTMPWLDYYPTPGRARGVQVDLRPERLGLRFPVEIGLVGDVRLTLQRLLPLLRRKESREFLGEAQRRMAAWNRLLTRIEETSGSPLRPQTVARAVGDLMADNAILALDCGANTHFSARHVRLCANQKFVSPGMLDTMAPGVPYAIAAQAAYPDRPCVAIVGDGGFAMLMAELTTAVQEKLPIKVVVMKNNRLAQVTFEQTEMGYPVFGCELGPIDFVAFARACGAQGFRCSRPDELRPALQAAFRHDGVCLVEAEVDPDEKPLTPDKLSG